MTATSLPIPVGRQREVLYLPHQGHVVVLGTAGSGKTTLAILRSLYLSAQSTGHGGRTLLVTFNRCLVTYMERLMSHANHKSVDVPKLSSLSRAAISTRVTSSPGDVSAPTPSGHRTSIAHSRR